MKYSKDGVLHFYKIDFIFHLKKHFKKSNTNTNTNMKKVKCSFCKKKTGLINFTCKCGGIFCSMHRYTHSHNCKYKEEKQKEVKKEIQKLNPKTTAHTLIKI